MINWIVEHNPVTITLNKIFEECQFIARSFSYIGNLINIPVIEKNAQNFFFGIGVGAITLKLCFTLYNTYQNWRWIPRHLQNRKKVSEENLKKRYGDCYAVVTGCTEGIGLSYATQMARLGFGIVFVARNRQKVQKRAKQIKFICPSLKYQVVIGDLTNVQDIKRVANQLADLTKRIDIGIVVNNAGLAVQKFGNFLQHKQKLLKDILNINFLAIYQVNRVILPILKQRKQKSAIINLSSGFGHFLSHNTGTYTHSKVMVNYYSRSLAIENKDKVDFITVRPFGVRTPMMNMKRGPFMISPKECVLSSLGDLLGNDTQTWTGFKHKVQATFLSGMSEQQIFQVLDKLLTDRK